METFQEPENKINSQTLQQGNEILGEEIDTLVSWVNDRCRHLHSPMYTEAIHLEKDGSLGKRINDPLDLSLGVENFSFLSTLENNTPDSLRKLCRKVESYYPNLRFSFDEDRENSIFVFKVLNTSFTA
jgi:hypothetical protein